MEKIEFGKRLRREGCAVYIPTGWFSVVVGRKH